MAVHILGIRHHGVGSAKKVLARLEELKPDLVMIEGPPEIDPLLVDIGHEYLCPPVAIMIHNEKNPSQSSFYPFSEFSPEWVAAKYANSNNIPVKALDLPANITFHLAEKQAQKEEQTDTPLEVPRDPLQYLADAAGFTSGEAWWEYQFEQVSEAPSTEHFEAVFHAMSNLRDAGIVSVLDKENIAREAYMRQLIRTAQNEMYDTIAVICGAWHAPALADLEAFDKQDIATLKKLPKSRIKVNAAWIPWTNSRLSRNSGYGAGLTSPGWYTHQWNEAEDMEVKWLTKTASEFRDEGVDISTAHVLETYKLAHALAHLRNKSQVTLEELSESIHTVMCSGESILFELVRNKLIVGEKMGSIPDHSPKVPLQSDFEATAKSLRLKFSPMKKPFDLDLRKPLDLQRSVFFHRLDILGIPWAIKKSNRRKGTFKESWVLTWDPAMEIIIIDRSFYGNTIEVATAKYLESTLEDHKLIAEFVIAVERAIPAELFDTIDKVLYKINNESTVSTDTRDLLMALPGLVNLARYGNVRKSDLSEIRKISERLHGKICISLPIACYGLDEDNSNTIFQLISGVDTAIKIMQDDAMLGRWHDTLHQIADKHDGIHMVIVGCTIRLLFDNDKFTPEESTRLFNFFLSNHKEPMDVAFWIEGFLRGSGLILIYDNRIWNLIYAWVDSVDEGLFMELLPVLRRAFSKFPFGERRQIGQKAKGGLADQTVDATQHFNQNFDEQRAEAILPHISKFLTPG